MSNISLHQCSTLLGNYFFYIAIFPRSLKPSKRVHVGKGRFNFEGWRSCFVETGSFEMASVQDTSKHAKRAFYFRSIEQRRIFDLIFDQLSTNDSGRRSFWLRDRNAWSKIETRITALPSDDNNNNNNNNH